MIPVSGKPSTLVVSACPPSAAGVELLPALAAVAAPQWSAVAERPSGRGVAVIGFEHAYRDARTGAARVRQAANVNANSDRNAGTTSTKLQDQFHLMSRRDPRTWRPPA